MQWEYKHINVVAEYGCEVGWAGGPAHELPLNKLGAVGWEVVHFNGGAYYLLKRQIK
jgi:hypothetical protein